MSGVCAEVQDTWLSDILDFTNIYTRDSFEDCPFCGNTQIRVRDSSWTQCFGCHTRIVLLRASGSGDPKFTRYALGWVSYTLDSYDHILKRVSGIVMTRLKTNEKEISLPDMSFHECLAYAQKCRILL